MNDFLKARIRQIALGYTISIFVVVEIIYLVIWLFVGIDSGQSLFGHQFSSSILGHLVSYFYLGIFTFPGWLIGVLIAEWFGIRAKIWFALGGALVGLSAFILEWAVAYGVYIDRSFSDSVPLVLGFIGGLVYGMIAGKHSGTWKENA
jgi:hypothetical protein